jgi:hypothetical protein
VVGNFSGEVCSDGVAVVCSANRIGAKLNASATSAIADPLNLLINRVHLPSPASFIVRRLGRLVNYYYGFKQVNFLA